MLTYGVPGWNSFAETGSTHQYFRTFLLTFFFSKPQNMKAHIKILQCLNLSFRLLKLPLTDRRVRSTFSVINSFFFHAVKSYAKFRI